MDSRNRLCTARGRWKFLYDLFLGRLAKVMQAVFEQISGYKWDGSDTFADYTASYTWIANQFGHTTIGLAFGGFSWIVVVLLSNQLCMSEDYNLWVSLGITVVLCLGYCVKEAVDFDNEFKPLPGDLPRPFRANPTLRSRYLDEIVEDAETDALFVILGALVGWSGGWMIEGEYDSNEFYFLLGSIFLLIWLWIKKVKVYFKFMRRRDKAGFREYYRLSSLIENFVWKHSTDNLPRSIDIQEEMDALMAAAAEATGGNCKPYCLLIVGRKGDTGARGTRFLNAIGGDAMWGLAPAQFADALYLDQNRAPLTDRPAQEAVEIAKNVGMICLDDFSNWPQIHQTILARLPKCVVVVTASYLNEQCVRDSLAHHSVQITSEIHLKEI